MKIQTHANIALAILTTFCLSTVSAQVGGYVVYKRTFAFGDNLFYQDTLRFKEGELLYIEKREGQNWKTRSGYDFKLAEADRAWFLDLAKQESTEQQYNPKAKAYELSQKAAHHLDWEIHEEYRQIGKYTVQKATAKHYHPSYGITTAWFATDIPVPGGPDRLWGLPGLILECSTKGSFKGAFTMEQIVFAPQSNLRPSEGQWVQSKDSPQVYKKSLRELLNKEY